ncbi:hypothetical protein [Streptomyces sp. NBC_00212]|uniref:hypothetical protein n=1 Tax=Streptomyces sp. NBC_00212 TaxID=2975684 RepID=UPI003865B5E0
MRRQENPAFGFSRAKGYDPVRRDAQVERPARVAGPPWFPGVGEGGEDVLVGGVVGQVRLLSGGGLVGVECENDLAGGGAFGKLSLHLPSRCWLSCSIRVRTRSASPATVCSRSVIFSRADLVIAVLLPGHEPVRRQCGVSVVIC